MALTKTLPSNFDGINATYWRISDETKVNPRVKMVDLSLYGYLDADHKDGEPVSRRGFTITNIPAVDAVTDEDGNVVTPAVDAVNNYDTYVQTGEDIRVGLYNYVKLQPEFEGAIDA